MNDIPVGVALPTADASAAVELARAVEDRGLDHVSISDVLLGDGTPGAEPLLLASAVAAATRHVRIEFGVLVLPLRDPVWTATQLATLQHLSGDRVVLGVGVGGFPGTAFWRAVGAPPRGGTAVFDRVLERLPGLLAGQDPQVTIAPPARVPPIVVGGGPGAVDRANRHGAGWFPSLVAPRDVAVHAGRVANGRVHAAVHAALGDDRIEAHRRLLHDLTGRMGLDARRADDATVLGGADDLAARIDAYATAGATSVTVALDGADPISQLGVVADARARLRS